MNPFIVVAVANMAAILARSFKAILECGARDTARCKIIVAAQSKIGSRRSIIRTIDR